MAQDQARTMAATPGAAKPAVASVVPDEGPVSVAADISPYLLMPLRSEAQVQAERIAEGRHPITGEELPWEDWDEGGPSTDRLREQVGMYVSQGDEP